MLISEGMKEKWGEILLDAFSQNTLHKYLSPQDSMQTRFQKPLSCPCPPHQPRTPVSPPPPAQLLLREAEHDFVCAMTL